MSVLTDKHLLSQKGIIEWTYPQLHRGKQWYVDFYAYDPAAGRMRRKKFMLTHIKGSRARQTMASQLTHNIVEKLKMGWNPFTNATRTRQFTPWAQVMKRYGEYLETAVAKGQLRQKTAYDYGSRLRSLEQYLQETDARIEAVYEFDKAFVVDYLDYLIYDKDVSARTRNNHRTWLSTVGAWLVDRQYLTTNPVEGVPLMREQEKFREPLTKEMLRQMREYLGRKNRHFLLACMMVYYANIRPEELRNLKVGDVSVKDQTVTVPAEWAKNHRAQAVGLHDRVLRLMIDLGVFSSPSHCYLFGKGMRPGEERAGINQFRQEWQRMRSALKWGKEYQFYSLKDSGIRDTITALGAVVARDQARHSDISVTNLYAKRGRKPDEGTKHFDGAL